MSDSDLTRGTRRVPVTHDGKPIGWTEPLDPDNPRRGRARQVLAFKAMQARRDKVGRIRSAQKRRSTRRSG